MNKRLIIYLIKITNREMFENGMGFDIIKRFKPGIIYIVPKEDKGRIK
jgi:hypothetical protein